MLPLFSCITIDADVVGALRMFNRPPFVVTLAVVPSLGCVGAEVGELVGDAVGLLVGVLAGFAVGELVGAVVGLVVGFVVGAVVGVLDDPDVFK